MSEYVIHFADIRSLGQVTVLVMPVMALSYLVTDTEKYKVSTLLRSPIVTRVSKFRNPEIYDAIVPLIFSAMAAVGFSIGLSLIFAAPYIWLVDLTLISLGICGLIIIFQIVLSITVPTLEKLLERHSESSAEKGPSIPNFAFLALASITLIILLIAISSLALIIFQSSQATIQ